MDRLGSLKDIEESILTHKPIPERLFSPSTAYNLVV